MGCTEDERLPNNMMDLCLFTSLMPTVDQKIRRALLAAIMLFCNFNKIFVDGYECL